jgi:hypothetical protein
MAWISEVKINFICQFQLYFFRMAPCVPVLGYLTDCPWPFKILERIELVLKTNCYYILWIIHFIQLLNFWSIQWISLNCVLLSCVICLLWYVTDQFQVHSILDLRNVKYMYVCMNDQHHTEMMTGYIMPEIQGKHMHSLAWFCYCKHSLRTWSKSGVWFPWVHISYILCNFV